MLVVGQSSDRMCQACKDEYNSRYYSANRARIIARVARWKRTPVGYVSRLRSDIKYNRKRKIARIAELEGELQFYGSP